MPYNNRFIFFDLETGGLIKQGITPPITEIAIIVLDNDLKVIQEYSSLVKPHYDSSKDRYEQVALDVSHITMEMCEREGKEASVVAKEVKEVLTASKGEKKPILCGHNIDSFDIPILDDFLSLFKIDLSKLVETSMTIDTKWWSRLKYPALAKYDLGHVIENSGIELTQAHRAMADTKANMLLGVNMIKCLRGELGVKEEKRDRDTFKFQF